MRIGFDAKRAAQNRTGLGNYSRFILEALTEHAPHNDYRLYVPRAEKTALLGPLDGRGTVCAPRGRIWKRLSSLWRVWGLTADLRRDGVRLFHGLSNELPFNIRRAKEVTTVVTIHDLIFLRYPQYYPLIDRRIYACKFRKACENADRVVAVSECTKRDIIRFFGIEETKIDVVYQGCDAQFKQPACETLKAEVRDKYDLPERYLLYVGSIEERKNLLLVARMLKETEKPLSVVAIGKRTAYAEIVERFLRDNGLEGRMTLLHNVPFRELPAFYQMASAFVYPSFFEGFGIPLLEALNCGIPVIGATGSCLEEAGGPHSLYVDPNDAAALARAVERVLSDEELRQTMIAEGRRYAGRFEPETIAAALTEVYRKAMKE